MTASNKYTDVSFTAHRLCMEEQSIVWNRTLESNDGLLAANQNLVGNRATGGLGIVNIVSEIPT